MPMPSVGPGVPDRLGSIDNRHDGRRIEQLPATEEVLNAPDPSGAAPAVGVLQEHVAHPRRESAAVPGTPNGGREMLLTWQRTRTRSRCKEGLAQCSKFGTHRALTRFASGELGSALAESSMARSADSAAADKPATATERAQATSGQVDDGHDDGATCARTS